MQLFDEGSCQQNVIHSDKEAFIGSLSAKILSQIEPSIKKDIIEGIRTAINS